MSAECREFLGNKQTQPCINQLLILNIKCAGHTLQHIRNTDKVCCMPNNNVPLAGKKSLEESFPHHNLGLVLLFQVTITCAYSLAIPSLYKFITTPTELPDELVCSTEVRHTGS